MSCFKQTRHIAQHYHVLQWHKECICPFRALLNVSDAATDADESLASLLVGLRAVLHLRRYRRLLFRRHSADTTTICTAPMPLTTWRLDAPPLLSHSEPTGLSSAALELAIKRWRSSMLTTTCGEAVSNGWRHLLRIGAVSHVKGIRLSCSPVGALLIIVRSLNRAQTGGLGMVAVLLKENGMLHF